MRVVIESDYLSFAYKCLEEYQGPLVVFGHSLGEEDVHLVKALKKVPRRIAVSVVPGDDDKVKDQKGRVNQLLPSHELVFFDASTHPLGEAQLLVRGE